MNPDRVKMTISIDRRLRDRMQKFQVNWSGVAARAFELEMKRHELAFARMSEGDGKKIKEEESEST